MSTSATGGPFYPGFDYRPARRPFSYDVFVSSSNEVADLPGEIRNLRQHVEDLVVRAFSPALAAYADAQLHVVRWEQALAGALPGESVNDTFVRMAETCHHTLVLLMTHLGPGTREEVEAVVERNLPISIVRFTPPDGYVSAFDPAEIDEFIQTLQLQRPILYCPCGTPGSPNAAEALARTLSGAVLGAYRKYLYETADPIVEGRG